MNVLILNASPRKGGNIHQMLDIIHDELSNSGATVQEVFVNTLDVKPCVACMKCRETHKCVMPEDDAHRVLELIRWCDALVIGAPCYWGNMPGKLKLLFDRMVYGMMGENSLAVPIAMHKGKRCILISTSSTMYPINIWFNQTRGVIKALREIMKWSGFRTIATIEKGGTYKKPSVISPRLRRRCIRAAHRL